MTEDEELMPPTQGAVVDPVLRGDAAGSQSKRAARKRLLAEVESEWHNFPNLPGTHLSWRKVGRGSWELINDSNRCGEHDERGEIHTTRSCVYLTGANLCMAAGQQ